MIVTQDLVNACAWGDTMAKRTASTQQVVEPGVLQRLRRAVQTSGLTADISSKGTLTQQILVTGRVAQTTVNYLSSLNPAAGQNLAEELQALASSEEFELLMEGRGYTFFHVVQFLYEFAKQYAGLPDVHAFCVGVGRAGGGLQIRPETDIISLIRLVVTAMPAAEDQHSIGLLVQSLAPLMLDKVFVTGDFHIEVLQEQEDRLRVSLEYADGGQVETYLKAFGLERDTGTFFLNSALQIQGTIEVGLRTLAQNMRRYMKMKVLVEDRHKKDLEEIEQTCSCAWTITWRPEIRLRRLTGPDKILAQGRTIYETLHRRDLEYFQERIKTLEMRVQALEEGDHFHELIGKSLEMRQVYRTIQQVAASDLTVLIRGETGTGKDLAAIAIHESSSRRDRPFVAVNCAAFLETLLESELFGYEKGAFTGADRTKPGRFELADGGTLFLDEVGDIPITTQVKLLRVLETQAFERVGGTETIQTDVRIIGATHRDLEDMIPRGEFREDFYFRLNVLPVNMPPLRAHREDIPMLAQRFLERSARRSGKTIKGFSRGAMQRLLNHSWPGNPRELQNVIERAIVVYATGPTITEPNISQALGTQERSEPSAALNLRQQQVLEAISQAEGCTVGDLMDRVASAVRGGSRRTLQNDLRKLTERGYLTWHKQGSAWYYMVTSEGQEVLLK